MKAVFTLAFSLLFLIAISSDSIPLRRISYKTELVTVDGEIQKGYLSHLNDSTFYISDVPVLFGSPDQRNKNRFSYPVIAQVSLRPKGSVGRGILFGALGGAAIGALIGLVTYQEPDCELGSWVCIDFGPGFSALGGGIIGTFGGGLIGGIAGASAKKTFSIGGKKEKFDAMKMSVLERAYSK